MSDSKVFMFPESVGTAGSSNSVDPNLLMSMMNNNGGGFGGNGGWLWVIFLFFLYGWGRNGMFGNSTDSTNNYLNNDNGRELLMQAINGNGSAIQNLSSMLNTSTDAISAAIASVNTAVTNVGSTVGLTGQQVINSIQQGNMTLAQQLSTCCCENKMLNAQNYANTISRIDQLANGITQGFASTNYATQAQTSTLASNLQNQTQTIIDKLSNMEANAQQDKINDLTAQLTAANARAERLAELQPIIAQLNSIKAAQPNTVAVTYPNLTAYPSYLNSMYGNSSFWN